MMPFPTIGSNHSIITKITRVKVVLHMVLAFSWRGVSTSWEVVKSTTKEPEIVPLPNRLGNFASN